MTYQLSNAVAVRIVLVAIAATLLGMLGRRIVLANRSRRELAHRNRARVFDALGLDIPRDIMWRNIVDARKEPTNDA